MPTTTSRGVFVLSAGLLGCLFLLAALPAGAEDFYVNTVLDTHDEYCTMLALPPWSCSLREAISLANETPGKDTIHLQPGNYVLTLEGAEDDLNITGDLDILEDVDIVGVSGEESIIRGNYTERVFHVFDLPGPMPAPLLQLFDLGVMEGGFLVGHTYPHGGGILVDQGAGLNLWRCVIAGNRAHHGAGIVALSGTAVLVVDTTLRSNTTVEFDGNPAGDGGAITMQTGGTLLIIRSTIFNNQATFGSAVGCGGYGTVNIVNTTIANNVNDAGQGAVHINSCNTVIDSTTFAGNTPHGVRGQFLDVYPWVARNTYFGDSCTFDSYCPVSEGGNVDAGMTCCVGPSDFENRPNLVGPLGDHGGYTQTMLPVAPYWPVVDNPGTSSNCQPEDQRGISRPQDFSGEPSPIACDTGAVELRDEDDVWIFSDGFESGGTSAWSNVVP